MEANEKENTPNKMPIEKNIADYSPWEMGKGTRKAHEASVASASRKLTELAKVSCTLTADSLLGETSRMIFKTHKFIMILKRNYWSALKDARTPTHDVENWQTQKIREHLSCLCCGSQISGCP